MKRTPLKSRSTSERSALEKKADRLVQESCALMFSGHCIRCKKNGSAGHHIVGRANKQLRHKLMNVCWLCETCHRIVHSHPQEFIEYLEQNWGTIYTWHLEHKNLPPERVTCDDLRTTIEELKRFIQTMKERRG